VTIVASEITVPSKATVDEIQEQILERICFAHYPPGTQLKEAVLAKEFGVSRTPVRDAIARIGHLGLVETRNGVGTVVIELSTERVRHLYEMRMELARLIGTLSPITVSEHQRDEARSIHENALGLRKRLDSQEYVKLNQQLQALITSLIGNHSLREFWNQAYFQSSSVWHRMEQIVGIAAYDALVQETYDLAKALEREDIAAVGFVQRIYIGYAFQLIEKHLLNPSEIDQGRSPSSALE